MVVAKVLTRMVVPSRLYLMAAMRRHYTSISHKNLVSNNYDVRNLDHGLFQFPRPTFKQKVGYIISGVMALMALSMLLNSLLIPDVPRIDEAQPFSSLPEDESEYTFTPVQSGYNPEEYKREAAFIIVPLTLETGSVATDECYWVEPDEDGNGGGWTYALSMADPEELTMVDSNGHRITAAFSLEGSLRPEGEMNYPDCSSEWTRYVEGYGENNSANYHFSAFMLVEQNPERYQLLSIQEISRLDVTNTPQEVTQREDRGRWALLVLGIGGLLFMVCSEPSLKHDLRMIRKANRERAKDRTPEVGILGANGRELQHVGADGVVHGSAGLTRDASEDWLFGAPPLPTAYTNFFSPDGDGALIPEHPSNIGFAQPATITPYSLGGLIFAGSFILLAADLRARDGSLEHVSIGWTLTVLVTIVNLVWFYHAWRQFKLIRAVTDLPTSAVRSAAVGQVELVGQVRPSRAGTPEFNVNNRAIKGLAAWQWTSYRYVCTTDSEGNTSCSWEEVESKHGGTPFVVHDGSGGMIVDPSMWTNKKHQPKYGGLVATWQIGDLKWNVWGLGIGDPVYVLGDCVPRSHDHMEEWGRDESLASSLVMMVPSTDTGETSILQYGTELNLIANNRSIFEILVVPCVVFLFSIFMFVSYSP